MGAAVASTGSAGSAAAAAACCVPVLSPLLVGVLGAGGAVWVAGLKPYSPYLLGGGLLLLVYAFWRVYGRASSCEADGSTASLPRWTGVVVLTVLWISAAVWVASAAAYLLFA